MSVKTFALFCLSVALVTPALNAATGTWAGAVDRHWSTPGNWDTGLVPANGDTLVFPDVASNKVSVNDLPAHFAVAGLQFTGGGYTISGNTLDIAGAVGSSSTLPTLNLGFRLTADAFLAGLIGGDVDLQGFTLSALGTISGVVSGTGGTTSGLVTLPGAAPIPV